MTEKEMDERCTALEMKVSFLEDFLNQVQEVAVEQEKTIELLHKEMKLMCTRMHEISDAMEGDIPNRKPPHY